MTQNRWYDIVDRFSDRTHRFRAALTLSGGSLSARANRGRRFPPDKVDALLMASTADVS